MPQIVVDPGPTTCGAVVRVVAFVATVGGADVAGMSTEMMDQSQRTDARFGPLL